MPLVPKPLHGIATLCVVLLALAGQAEEPGQAGWTLAKEKDGLHVYHRYMSPDDTVPRIRIAGTLNIPYADAGAFIWDPELKLVSHLNSYIVQAETLPPADSGNRLILYVFRVPLTARAAVRVGSGLLGSLGRVQYSLMEMQMQSNAVETRISWSRVPVSAELRAGLSGFEVLRNSGSWFLQPADGGQRTTFIYELDAFPGGKRVPAGLVNWANNTCVRVPRLMEKAYRDLNQARDDHSR